MKKEITQVKHDLEVAVVRYANTEHDASITKEAWQMLQHRLDLTLDINEELIQEIKTTHWRIIRLAIDDSAGERLAMGKALTMMVRTSISVRTKNPRVMGASFMGSPGKQLQVGSLIESDVATQAEYTCKKYVDP